MTAALRFWWAAPIVGLLAAWLWTANTLADTRLTLANERGAWTSALKDADAARLKTEARFTTQLAQAAATYGDRMAAREPIIIRSTNTVREYAQTDAGRAVCLGTDRVRGLDALDASLFAANPAGASWSDNTLPTDPD